jgi:hypothetical protein
MKITVAKIKKKLEKEYGWGNICLEQNEWFINEIIKDTLKIIDKELLFHQNISIKK